MTSRLFDRAGTSDYPVKAPYIGQEDAFNKLQEFLSAEPDDPLYTLPVFGEWGAGKTRIGHQLVAGATDNSPGWMLSNGSGEHQKTELFQDSEGIVDNTVLPLWVHFSECADEITSDNAARVLINQAVENLINSEGAIQRAIQEHIGEELGYELEDILLGGGKTETELLSEYLDKIVTESDFDRLLIIVDEIEEAGAIGTGAPDSEETEGVERRTIQALYEGLKEAHNDEGGKYPENLFADVVLLCTKGVESYIPSGGTERRVKPVRLSRPTIREAYQCKETVLENSDGDFSISDACVKALFFASFNNYGWFTRAMSSIEFRKRQQDLPYYKILQKYSGSFDDIFDPSYTDDIRGETENKSVARKVEEVIYRITPVATAEIGLSEAETKELTQYTTPLEGIHPVARLQKVKVSPIRAKRELQERGFETESRGDEKVTTIGSEELDTNRLEDLLEVFSDEEGNLFLHTDEDELSEMAEYAFGQGQVDSTALDELVATLADLAVEYESSNDDYVGPTMTFLKQWNKRWRKLADVVQWIRDDETWEEMMAAARNVTTDKHERILKGFVHTRFKHYETGAPGGLEPNGYVDSPNLVVDIPAGDQLDVTAKSQVIAINPTDTDQLRSDLNKIQRKENQYPIVYVIFNSETKKDALWSSLLSDYPRLAPFLRSHVASNTHTQRDFYIQMSFLGDDGDGGFSADAVYALDQTYIDDRRRGPIVQSDEEWLADQRKAGRVLSPVSVTGSDPALLAEGILEYCEQGAPEWRGAETSEAWDEVNEASDPYPLIRFGDSPADDTLDIPAFVPQTLTLIDDLESPQIATIAGCLLFEGADRTPESTVQSLLDLLEGLSLIDTDADGGYMFVDDAYLADEIVDSALAKAPDDLETYFDDFYYPPSDTTRIDLRIDSGTTQDRREEIETQRDEIQNIPFETFNSIDVDTDAWRTAIVEVNDVVVAARQWYDPDIADPDLDSISNEELADHYSELREDTVHEEYSIQYKLQFLTEFDDILEDVCEDLIPEVQTCVSELDTTYGTCGLDGKEFPTARVETLLSEVEDDISLDLDRKSSIDSTLLADEDGQLTNNTVVGHIENQEFADAFRRLMAYERLLKGNGGFWEAFTTAHSAFGSFLAEYNDFEATWEEAVAYYQDATRYRKALRETEIPLVDPDEDLPDPDTLDLADVEIDELSTFYEDLFDEDGQTTPESEMTVIRALVDDPTELSDSSDTDPSDLRDQTIGLRCKLEFIKFHVSVVEELSDAELQEDIDDLNEAWKPLAHLLDTLEKEVELEKTAYEDEETFSTKRTTIQETIDKIDPMGKQLLKEKAEHGERYWDPYVQVFDAAEKESDLPDGDIDTDILDDLRDWGLIEYTQKISVSIDSE